MAGTGTTTDEETLLEMLERELGAHPRWSVTTAHNRPSWQRISFEAAGELASGAGCQIRQSHAIAGT